MPKKNYETIVSDFYDKHKPFKTPYRSIDAKEGGHTCQICGNRRLRYLCIVSNQKDEEWEIGRDCHTHLEELIWKDWKIAMDEIVTCVFCGDKVRRGDLPQSAYAKRLCRRCWQED